MNINEFTFLVFSYNHEKYITEHLESIKYLIQTYAAEIYVDIILNDDCSKDKTIQIIDAWIENNRRLFRNETRLFNNKNIGTCASVVNALSEVRTPCFKMTAGDDVYSFENIFLHSNFSRDTGMISGIPIRIVDDQIIKNKFEILSVILTQKIYENKPLRKRFVYASNNNAPNMMFNSDFIRAADTYAFIKKFDVVEDWPMQVHVAEKNPNLKFLLKNKVFVYYRRTTGSTYIVASERFKRDKNKMFQYLIDGASNFFEKLILINRRYVFLNGGKRHSKYINISLYLFAISSFLKLRHALRLEGEIRTEEHIAHYNLIKNKSRNFLNYITLSL